MVCFYFIIPGAYSYRYAINEYSWCASFFWFIIYGCYKPDRMAQSMISNVVSQNQRGSFMSVNGSMQQLGQGMASLIAGVIVKTN